MVSRISTVAAVAAATFSSLALTGSAGISAPPGTHDLNAEHLYKEGQKLYNTSRFSEAHDLFITAAIAAEKAGDTHAAAMDWGNAGACSLIELQYGAALESFRKARRIAENASDFQALASTLNNTANLYVHMGESESAMRTAREALDGPARRSAGARLQPKLRIQIAMSLAQLHRFDEALPVYREGIAGMLAQGDETGAARALSSLADESLRINRREEADAALRQGMALVNGGKADAKASLLDGLARLRAVEGRPGEAAALFDQAIAVPASSTPRWKLYLDRAQFRLSAGALPQAMEDFREARLIATRMRVDIVPADQDRVGLEQGMSEVAQGLIETGNRLARNTGDSAILAETFDAAEQDRQWSLRALLPGVDDWRSRLPGNYWGLLAKYQQLERLATSKRTVDAIHAATLADDELKRIEAEAGRTVQSEAAGSALQHVRDSLAADAVLLSFHISKTSSWVWSIDRHGAAVYPLPPFATIEREAAAFTKAVHEGSPEAEAAGRRLYSILFGGVRAGSLGFSKWLIEPDGPLYSVPFAALVVSAAGERPTYLIEKATLQSIPGALLLSAGGRAPTGRMIAIGDPVYNGADPRYRRSLAKPDATLPRLPNTAAELDACSRAWGQSRTRILAGSDASAGEVRAAIGEDPDIIHFATHVVPSPGDFRTGLIALSLENTGAMGMLGPREIVARPVRASLVVMDGCHSAQAEALPGSGLMGLTRAWIGAGASAVLATQWDIADDKSQLMMDTFYKALARGAEVGVAGALREAQLAQLHAEGGRRKPAYWAGYYLESRVQ